MKLKLPLPICVTKIDLAPFPDVKETLLVA